MNKHNLDEFVKDGLNILTDSGKIYWAEIVLRFDLARSLLFLVGWAFNFRKQLKKKKKVVTFFVINWKNQRQNIKFLF